MLKRCFDKDRINAIVNDPSVRPFVGAPEMGDLDMTPVIDRHENWFLLGEHGGFLLIWSAPFTREVHTFILPSGRGKWAADARQTVIDYAAKNGVKMLWTKIAPEHRHTDRFARQGGMQLTDEVIETFGKPYRVYWMELP